MSAISAKRAQTPSYWKSTPKWKLLTLAAVVGREVRLSVIEAFVDVGEEGLRNLAQDLR